ncbi:hypothetical protein GGQ85_002645 [Nitrobacter vulgaris]|uniref:phage tail-collar fiber domain-containing protein n=1 Tax=Nitrobacter vulgaris TaxID=29421 RepID=UPI00286579CA|nr:phage tail protein [Nitrobacter vulgaris]MDR6304929.1 hypothetical protein [Nitrobacter vulgaris]
MPQTSFALLTNLGRAKEAAAFANSTTVEITHIAIGDGATVPSGGETALYNQLALKTISDHGTVVGASNVAYFDCFLEAAEGPYTIREAGLYDVDGDLIAIAHYDPPISKPTPASGQTVEGTIRLEVAFSNVANITISIDPSMKVALQRLTVLRWIPIISMSLATPPASPVAGDTYVIATSPTGSWSGQAGKIAEYTTAGWAIIAPPNGHGVSLPDGRVFERVSGTYVEKIALDSQSGKWVYAADSGTANAMVVTLDPVPAALTSGMIVRVKKSANANTGATTLNVNGLGAKAVARLDGSDMRPDDLPANMPITAHYDGTINKWVVVNFVGNYAANGPFSEVNLFGGSGTLTVPHATYTKRSFTSATIGAHGDVSLVSGSCKILTAGRYFVTTTAICGSDPATYPVVGQYPSAILKNSSLLSNGSGFAMDTAKVKEVSGSNVFVADFAANDLLDAAIYQGSAGASSASFSTSVAMSIVRVR